MVRTIFPIGLLRRSFPRARGDGPLKLLRNRTPGGFSPRPWGWSEPARSEHLFLSVIPAAVGMVLFSRGTTTASGCYPRARGDGPRILDGGFRLVGFPPRPWGWSEPARSEHLFLSVFPAAVGMVRNSPLIRPYIGSFPLARGDGPFTPGLTPAVSKLSPRAWGWSAGRQTAGWLECVIPSRVGMVRFRYNRLHLLDLL